MKYLKVMKGKNLQSRILYLARVSFIFNGETQSFTDKQKLREFSTTKAKRIQYHKTSFTTKSKKPGMGGWWEVCGGKWGVVGVSAWEISTIKKRKS